MKLKEKTWLGAEFIPAALNVREDMAGIYQPDRHAAAQPSTEPLQAGPAVRIAGEKELTFLPTLPPAMRRYGELVPLAINCKQTVAGLIFGPPLPPENPFMPEAPVFCAPKYAFVWDALSGYAFLEVPGGLHLQRCTYQ